MVKFQKRVKNGQKNGTISENGQKSSTKYGTVLESGENSNKDV